ncbi:Zinc finger C2H2 [Penicillium hordei]|uniref:Zinc finger C2H2 n=1 Tax=Penicillium hordei TaxID=40994 RepID=A0AAD6EBP8_9EURO|nr:Zinc finger C2H2 [Penicillium hordei]KAJ5607643.1 Zinc finger C2H2 [Penicillium hordei]
MDLANLLSHSTAVKPVYTPLESSYYKRSPPLSPPAEEPKVSLPSISSLFEGADSAQHSASEYFQLYYSPITSSLTPYLPERQRLSPSIGERHVRVQSYELPPTPPLRPGSGHAHRRTSPVESLSHKEAHHHHLHRSSISSNGSIHTPRNTAPYASPAPSVSSYTSPIDTPQQPMYYPRPPTTSSFQPSTPASAPQMPTVQVQTQQPHSHSSSALISPVTPAWQHHHYFPPSTSTPYQQNHDRYICRTCHKAFSRPSSLRIHSHSHTGEKPFRCTHAGCGKAFSVRSNMKRHERGCHSGRPGPASAATALVV